MRKKSLFYRLTLGLLISALIIPAQPAQAQFGGIVFDPKNYALQVQKRLEEAQKYVQMFDNAVKQYTTLRGVLGKAEELVTNQLITKNTMANIGLTVRASLQLKEQAEAIITTRLTMLKSIDDRLRRGIFDPEADLRDLEDYLRTLIGRSSQDSLANLQRLRRMDNTLERLIKDLQNAEVALAETVREKITLDLKLAAATNPQQPASKIDATGIGSLIEKISNCELLIAQYKNQVAELQKQITERAKKYHALMDARIQFGDQVNKTNKAWTEFNNTLNELQRTLDKY